MRLVWIRQSLYWLCPLMACLCSLPLPAHFQVEFSESTGRALSLSVNAILTISGSAKFLGNTAGGALQMTDSTGLTLESAEFLRNSAEQGGAMMLERFSVVTVTGSLLVQENTAIKSGGGVFVTDRAQLQTQGEATFSLNSAAVSGGGLDRHR